MKEQVVFFDIYELAPASGSSLGIYNYAKQIFHALVSVPRPGLKLFVVCNDLAAADFHAPDALVPVEYKIIRGGRPGMWRRVVWTYIEAALCVRRARATIYFSPRGFLPRFMGVVGKASRTAVTIHDLIPLWYREHFSSHFGRLHQWFICSGLVGAARRSDLVVTISDASAEDIRLRTQTTTKIRRIYNGMEAASPNSSGGPRDYFLAMTSALPHKNAACVLQGYRLYRRSSERPFKLIVCGLKQGAESEDGVEFVSGISDAALKQLYAGAKSFVFLSLTEGFGFPPLEAMAVGTESICSDIPVLREITRGVATYVDPGSPGALALALQDAESAPYDIESSNKRRLVAATYSWQDCAAQLAAEFVALDAHEVPSR